MADAMDLDKLALLEKASAVLRDAKVGFELAVYNYGMARGRRARDAELREAVRAMESSLAFTHPHLANYVSCGEVLSLLTEPTLPTGGTDG